MTYAAVASGLSHVVARPCPVRVLDGHRVASDRVRILDPGQAVEVAELFRLLDDAGRVRLLRALLEAAELCVCDLAAVVGMAESSVSHSRRLLRAVRHRWAGRQFFYCLPDAHVRHGAGE